MKNKNTQMIATKTNQMVRNDDIMTTIKGSNDIVDDFILPKKYNIGHLPPFDKH